MSRTLALLLVIALGTFGCEPEPDVEPLPCRNQDPGVADLGAGDLSTGFLELIDGQDIKMAFGPQGMHMITVGSRVLDMEPTQAGGIGNRVTVAIRHEGAIVGGTVAEMQPSAETAESTDFLGVRAVFTVAEVDELDGEEVDVEIIVRDGCGRELGAERPLRLVL